MEQPEGCSEPGQEPKVLRLRRAIYGLNVTRRLARGLSCSAMMTTPSFVAGLSQVRPERLIE